MQLDSTQHKEQLRSYFDGIGFARWQNIYGSEPIKGVRKSVREGHARVVETALQWLAQHNGQRTTDHGHILDAGCGTGLLTVALAERGWQVKAVDIAPQMAEATKVRAQNAGVAQLVETQTGDLDIVEGEFDAVVCLDVLIHYPQALFAPMLRRLVARTRGPLLFTYAPHEPLLATLHWVGGMFPKPQRRTEIQMIPEAFVHATLAEAGMGVRQAERVSVGFYHVALVEAVFM